MENAVDSNFGVNVQYNCEQCGEKLFSYALNPIIKDVIVNYGCWDSGVKTRWDGDAVINFIICNKCNTISILEAFKPIQKTCKKGKNFNIKISKFIKKENIK